MLQKDDSWPDFRGPRFDGHSPVLGVPQEWSETKNVQWKTPLPETGWSSPVVWGKQVWLTCATMNGKEQSALCFDRDSGKLLKKITLFRNEKPQYVPLSNNTYASPSPVIEKGRVFIHFGTFGTACLDTKTYETLWTRRDLNCEHSQGPGSSPFQIGRAHV